jgi:hypothetical protein
MRLALVAISVLVIAATAFVGVRPWQFSRLWPRASTESVQLTQEKRVLLQHLRSETKFTPTAEYAGAATPSDRDRATASVNAVIDAVLAQPIGPIHARVVSSLIGGGMKAVGTLETEDRDRTQGYMLEVWYILGFKGATGQFAYGSAYPKPQGYGEPLPPGWTAPDRPRPIG